MVKLEPFVQLLLVYNLLEQFEFLHPIEGVSTEMIANLVTKPCCIVEREELAQRIGEMDTDVVVSFGAGNIDACCEALAKMVEQKS